MKDPGIKLFGMKINALPENDKSGTEAAADSTAGGGSVDSDQDHRMMEVEKSCLDDEKVQGEEKEEAEKEHVLEKDCASIKAEEESPREMMEESSPESDGNPKTPSIEEDTATGKQGKNDQSDTTNSQNKTLKKPDKILPCPRCNSMDTKFCYYNNYNVNQPRHFCKSCQRYWTAGGTMRSMPVGAGRRKNKNSNSHCRYITIPEPFQATRIDANDGNKVLSFGPGSPILESMASGLNLVDKRKVENGDDCSSGSSITTSNSSVEKRQEIHGFPSQIQCIPGVNAWPFPIMCPPGYPPTMPFYPPPYYGAWNFPWLQPPPPPPTKAQVLDSNLPVLGKHSREGDILNPCANPGEEPRKIHNGTVLIPKTLRIDDPDEAAKSSIWATLGIKNENIGNRGGLFKAFQSKGEEKNHPATTSPALQANPAALSRSLCFQERV